MSRTILVVGSSDTERMFLVNLLCDDYNIIEAAKGEEAVEILINNLQKVSAVVIDILKSDIAGLETLRKIKERFILQQMPVIITSDLKDNAICEAAYKYGANNYITKPYNKSMIFNIIQNIIKLREVTSITNAVQCDSLTGLLNRDSFYTEAMYLIRHHEPGYYILSCIDVENFKVINDLYGEETGNEILRHIADCLNKFISNIKGIAGRHTADTFMALFPAKMRDSELMIQNHDRIIHPECIGRSIKIRIGRYVIDDPSIPVNTMLDRAVMAEKSIKGRFDTSIAEYSHSMMEKLLREQTIINNMEEALENGEFEPWFQPQYNHVTGALIGAEALVRWRKGDKFVSPADFVPVFERNGFIYEMDQYIWEQVCIFLRRWLDDGLEPLPVSVNISRRDIFHKHFISVITNLVNKYRLPYDLIRLEVTESAFSDTTNVIVSRVNQLIELGFTVEIDDFGSGYSSLNTLKDVPVSILKLDMCFFEKTDNKQRSGNIIESVVRMAKWLGMSVIAEGVEKREQADFLKSIGCCYIQGYFYAKPMPVEAYERLISKSKKESTLAKMQTLKNLDNIEFWNPDSIDTLIFNSYVGAACILEYFKGKIEMLRVSDDFIKMLGSTTMSTNDALKLDWVSFMDTQNLCKFSNSVIESMETHEVVSCYNEFIGLPGCTHKLFLHSEIRVIATTGDRILVYCLNENITAQKEAEQRQAEAEKKQHESAQRLQVIMDNVNGGVSAIIINDDGTSKFLFNNEKYFNLYGYTREQVETENIDIMTCILPEDFDSVMEKIRKLKEDRNPVIIDYRIKRRDGKLAFLSVNATLMRIDGYGDVITSVITDVTKQRSLEDQLRSIVDNIYGGVSATYIKDGQSQFLFVNDQFFKILGYSSRDEYEENKSDKYAFIHPEDKKRIIDQFESFKCGKTHYTMEYRIIRKDGAVRNMRNNIRVINLFGIDEPVQLSVVNDITDECSKNDILDNYIFFCNDIDNLQGEKDTQMSLSEDSELSNKRKKMLVVDDSKLNQAIISGIFNDEFDIETADSGADALMCLQHCDSEISVVLLDLLMPGMDGYSVLKKMRSNTKMQSIPVIVISGDEESDTVINVIKAGASDFITKPIDAELLRMCVASVISRAENEKCFI